MRIGAVVLRSSDPVRLAEFYREGFGLPEPKQHAADHWGMMLDNTYLGFDLVADAAPSATTVWFEVEDCIAVRTRLLALGARPGKEPARDEALGELLATVFDPDGNPLGLVETERERGSGRMGAEDEPCG